jgi:hypothetical protein
MSTAYLKFVIPAALIGLLPVTPATAQSFSFGTGSPDGKIATLSRTASAGKLETETADDFVTTRRTEITSATFTGLLVGVATADVSDVEIELYHVFPIDSTFPPASINPWPGASLRQKGRIGPPAI